MVKRKGASGNETGTRLPSRKRGGAAWSVGEKDSGGRTAAVLLSFTSTCQRLGVEPWAYLQDVLTRLPSLPAAHLAELLPDRWEAARRAALADPASAGPSATPPPPGSPA